MYSPNALKALNENISIDPNIKLASLDDIGGVMPKATLILDGNMLKTSPREDFNYLAKATRGKKDVPQNEHFFIWLANQTNMKTSSAELVKSNEDYLFLSKNFLKENQTIIPFAQIINKDVHKKSELNHYFKSLDDLVEDRINLKEIHKDIFKQMLFSNTIGNFDMHSRNISLVATRENSQIKLSVAPAYDIVSTRAYFNHENNAIGVNGKYEYVSIEDLLSEFNKNSLLSDKELLNISSQILDSISSNISQINNSMMDKNKIKFLENYISQRVDNYTKVVEYFSDILTNIDDKQNTQDPDTQMKNFLKEAQAQEKSKTKIQQLK